jgi:hypothetical protein
MDGPSFTAAPVLYDVIMKRLRFLRTGLPHVRGRQYRAEEEITYTGGTLSEDVCKSLTSALTGAMGTENADVSWSVSSDPYSRLMVSVTLVADRPLAAITRLDRALDDSLSATGLWEEFDVTGRVLRVAPTDRAWRDRRNRP